LIRTYAIPVIFGRAVSAAQQIRATNPNPTSAANPIPNVLSFISKLSVRSATRIPYLHASLVGSGGAS
jgi:hypothetical protein